MLWESCRRNRFLYVRKSRKRRSEIESTMENWSKRKKPKRYADPSTATKILNNVKNAMNNVKQRCSKMSPIQEFQDEELKKPDATETTETDGVNVN